MSMSKKEAIEYYGLSPEEVYGDRQQEQCPYPDCNGWLEAVSENYGADADGNRGMMIHYSQCSECERDPDDYDEDSWKEETTEDLLRRSLKFIASPSGFELKNRKALVDDLSWFIEQYF